MPTEVPIQDKTESPTYVAADPTGNLVFNRSQPHLWVLNQHPTDDLTVTIVAQRRCNLGVLHDAEYVIPSGQQFPIGPFRNDIYTRLSDLMAEVQWSFTQSAGQDVVFVAAQRLC